MEECNVSYQDQRCIIVVNPVWQILSVHPRWVWSPHRKQDSCNPLPTLVPTTRYTFLEGTESARQSRDEAQSFRFPGSNALADKRNSPTTSNLMRRKHRVEDCTSDIYRLRRGDYFRILDENQNHRTLKYSNSNRPGIR